MYQGNERDYRSNLSAAVIPTASDDETIGYRVGSHWVDTVVGAIYVCLDQSTAAAVWSRVDNTGGTISVQLLRTGVPSIPYATISLALAAATSGDVVLIGKGTYAENIAIPAGVVVLGALGDDSTVTIQGVAGGPAVTMDSGSILRYIRCIGHTDAHPVVYTTAASGSAGPVIDGCCISGGGGSNTHGFHHAGDAFCKIKGSTIDGTGVLTGSALRITAAGSVLLDDVIFAGTAQDAIYVSDGTVLVQQMRTLDTSVYVYGIHIAGGAAVVADVHNAHIGVGVANALYFGAASDGSNVQIHGGELIGATADVSNHASAAGTGTTLVLTGVAVRNEKTTLIPAWRSTASIAGFIADEGINDDPAHRFLGSLAFGSPGLAGVTSFGEGDPSTHGMYVFAHDGSAAWVDNTAALAASGAATATLFNTLNAGGIAYFGSQYRAFPDLDVVVGTAIDLGSGTLVWEYWDGTWVSIAVMATDGDHPAGGAYHEHQSWAQVVFGRVQSDHIYLEPPSGWAASTINSQSAYWLRCRIATGPITTAPVLSRVKLGTHRRGLEGDGYAEDHGMAQKRKSIWHYRMGDDLTGASPSNGAVTEAASISGDAFASVFSNSAIDGRITRIKLPVGINTARALEFSTLWHANLNGGPSAVELEARYSVFRVGSTLDGSIASVAAAPVVTTVGAADDKVVKETSFSIPIADMVPGDVLVIAFFRDATAGNGDDTLSGGVTILVQDLTGYYWA